MNRVMANLSYNARPYLESWFTGYHEGSHYAAVAGAIEHLKDGMLAAKQDHLSDDNHAIKVRAALDYVMQHIEVETSASGAPEFLFNLQLNELDFSFSEPVYSTVPRLLLRVPDRHDGPVDVIPTDKPVPISVAQMPKSDSTLISFANEEGEQADVKDRPIVQINHLAAGEYVIIGKIPLSGRDEVWGTVSTIMQPAEDENPFKAFDERGTVVQLGAILTSLRNLGYSNQYNTDDTYRRSLASLPDAAGADANVDGKLSGFYEKPSQNVKASLLHLVGDFNMQTGGRANEIVRGNGYALAEIAKDGQRDRRPISADYAKTFNSRVSDEPLAPAVERISFPTFKPDHALGDFGFAFNAFVAELGAINADYARGEKPAPGIRAAYG
jgi:hypothetical protein